MWNIKIGKNCVIGSNTIVKSDIPDYSVAVGAPAKIVKMYDFEDKKWKRVRNNQEIQNILIKREKY